MTIPSVMVSLLFGGLIVTPGAGQTNSQTETLWLTVPVAANHAFIPTGMYLGVPFVPLRKSISNLAPGDPPAAIAVKEFYEAARSGNNSALQILIQPGPAGVLATTLQTIQSGISDLQSPTLDGLIFRPGDRIAAIVRGIPIKGRPVRIHWLTRNLNGKYVFVQPGKASLGDALINESLLATAIAPTSFPENRVLVNDAKRRTIVLLEEPTTKGLELKLNFLGRPISVVFSRGQYIDPTSALGFYVDVYKALLAGNTSRYLDSIESAPYARTNKAKSSTDTNYASLSDAVSTRVLVYLIDGTYYTFIFFDEASNSGARPRGVQHEGVLTKNSRFYIRPSTDVDTIDELVSADDFQNAIRASVVRK